MHEAFVSLGYRQSDFEAMASRCRAEWFLSPLHVPQVLVSIGTPSLQSLTE